MATTYRGLMNLIGKLELRKITEWSVGYDKESDHGIPAPIDTANVVTSAVVEDQVRWGQRHHVLLDLDREAHLIPSSTPGHFHLYVDLGTPTTDLKYFRFLDAAADIGLIESGYANASRARGASYLRLPWAKKGGVNV